MSEIARTGIGWPLGALLNSGVVVLVPEEALEVHVQPAWALTPRELGILRLLASDLSEREIGRELFVSHSTVHGHVRSIYRKLGVSSRVGALERSRELGLMCESP